MKKTVFVVGLTLLFCSVAAAEGDWEGNINLNVGSRTYSSAELKDLGMDQAGQGILEVDFKKKSWPMAIYLASAAASMEKTWYYTTYTATLKIQDSEFDIGARKYFQVNDIFFPYVSFGLAMITRKADASATSGNYTVSAAADDSGNGLLLNGGLLWRLGGSFNLGLDARIVSGADHGNYSGAGLFLGYHW